MVNNRTKYYTVTLSEEEWNTVLDVLDEAPYRIACPIVLKITSAKTGIINFAPENTE